MALAAAVLFSGSFTTHPKLTAETLRTQWIHNGKISRIRIGPPPRRAGTARSTIQTRTRRIRFPLLVPWCRNLTFDSKSGRPHRSRGGIGVGPTTYSDTDWADFLPLHALSFQRTGHLAPSQRRWPRCRACADFMNVRGWRHFTLKWLIITPNGAALTSLRRSGGRWSGPLQNR
jgi:hypothetical protein